jgi:hypothetical protein
MKKPADVTTRDMMDVTVLGTVRISIVVVYWAFNYIVSRSDCVASGGSG